MTIRKICWFVMLLFTLSTLHGQVTATEAISQMTRGINIGNSLEAAPGETSWGNPLIQEYFFDMYADAGFNTVRIPVRWDQRTALTSPYAIDEAFLDRVEQVVDWGLARDLYIIINAHHEEWIKSEYDIQSNRDRFDSIWSQISLRFAGKSDHLVFEIINEPYGLTKEQNDDLHARVLSIIREKNPDRLVIFQGHNWGGSEELVQAAIPADDDPYLVGSFHSYDPWPFGLEGTGTFGAAWQIQQLHDKFDAVKNWSDATGIPVFLGEFGCHKDADYLSRMTHYQTYVELAQEFGFCPCAWDDGGSFKIMQRSGHSWNEIKDILIHGSMLSPAKPVAEVYQDTLIRLSWTNRSEDAESIVIQRTTNPSGGFQDVATVAADATDFIDIGLEQNATYYYRVIARNTGSGDLYAYPVKIFLPEFIPEGRQPYTGNPFPVPGIIEAEDFDYGGEGVSYHDSDDNNVPGDYRTGVGVDIYDRLGDGYHVGNFIPGEWLEYTIDIPQSGTYKVIFYTASQLGGGSLKASIGGVSSGQVVVPSTGSSLTTDTVSVVMALQSGEQICRVTCMSDPSFNFDKFELQLIQASGISNTATTGDEALVVNHVSGYAMECKLKSGKKIDVIEIYDLSGRQIFRQEPVGEAVQVHTGTFPGGLIIIRVISGDNRVVQKYLFQK